MKRIASLRRLGVVVLLGLNLLAAEAVASRADAGKPRTNLVLILTDNQGAWTLGCYGNEDIRTPHLDRLAAQGMRFTRAFANNAVCSPTRASLLTGLMPCQHGVHKYISRDVMLGAKAYSTIEEFDTLPQILHEAGYVCGLSGKWHLGDHTRPQEGFSFWVTKTGGHTTGFVNQDVIEDGEIRKEPTHQTVYWTRRACEFIEKNRSRPFFLLLAYNGPYGLGKSMLKPSASRHAATYADKALPSFPRHEPHPWLHNNRKFINNPVSIRKYAAEVSAVDDGVGEVMITLAEHGLDKNTLVVFMADQGLAGGHGGFWGMGDHTRPLTAYDPMIHVPLIVRHPGEVPAGSRCDHMVGTCDIMPTLLGYLGLAEKMPTQPASPGRRFDQALRGRALPWKDVVFYEFENLRAIRTEAWKYIERYGDAPDELYHLARDPKETINLIDNPKHAATRKQLRDRLHAFFDHYAAAKWDLWHGGDAKGGLLLGKKPYQR